MIIVGGVLVVVGVATGVQAFAAAAAVLALIGGVVVMVVRPPARAVGWWLLLLRSGTITSVRVGYALGIEPLVVAGVAVADVRASIGWAALLAGLVLVGLRAAKPDLANTLDAFIVALDVFLLMWLFLLNGEVTPIGGAPGAAFARWIGAAATAGVLAGLVFVVDWSTPAFRLLVAGVVCTEVGAALTIAGPHAPPLVGSIDSTGAPHAAYAVLVTAALLHPSSTHPLAARQRGESRFSAARTAAFAALTLLGPLTWVVAVLPTRFRPQSVAELGLPIAVSALISLLLLWRLALIAQLADRRAEQLASLQAELIHRATHDPLTGLSNRADLTERLDALLIPGREAPPALLMLDLDGFKHINDTLGHPVGDELLVEVGHRLRALAPPGATVVRLGGDEFAILLAEADERTAMALAEEVRTRLSQPYPTSRGVLSVSCSIGLYVPHADGSPGDILRGADLALYEAKAAGKDRVRVFNRRADNVT